MIDSQTKKEFVKKDSLSAVKFLDSLAENNYYFTKILKIEKQYQTTQILFDKGKNFNEAEVEISEEVYQNLKMQPKLFTKNLDSLKKSINQKYIDQGFAFNRVKTKYLGIQNGIPRVAISVNTNQKRKIDGFVVKGYEKVPKRFIKNLEKEYSGKIYNDKNLIFINQSLQNHPFVLLEKPPQTLFTKDSTNIYLFLQKKKANTFDGIVGFGNDKSQKFTFNGTLDVNFRNMFNGFEELNIYWQRNADKGQTFDLKIDIPYVFGSNLGVNLQSNIFRQDSTFATVKFRPAIYLHFSNRTKLGIRGIIETSTITNPQIFLGKDYNKKGLGAWYEFMEPSEEILVPYKSKIYAEANVLSVKYQTEENSTSQNNYYLLGERNFHILGNHYLNLKGEISVLNSKNNLSTNELLRFGGWNSLRGFNENSLLADFYYYTNTEYRYLITNQAFFDIFGQFAQLNNKTLSINPKLYSFGVGFNFLLPIGLMSFQISNGNEFGNQINFRETKIHWGILARF